MMSGDGLLVRVKPAYGRLDAQALTCLADLSDQFGNGVLDLTSRANLQIRGVFEQAYPALLSSLHSVGLAGANLKADQLNLTLAPFTGKNSLGWRWADYLYAAADDLPELPAKFGFSVDCGKKRYLTKASADLFIEAASGGEGLLRCAGSTNGLVTDEDNLLTSVRAILDWYLGLQAGAPDTPPVRMRKLLEAQYPNGAWPQRYDGAPKRPQDFPVLSARYPKTWSRVYPKANYINHYTFNDNSHRDCVLLALEAHRVTGRLEYLQAARRGGEFILRAQMPEPQPVWAQQYNARMEPAWARKFEPPSVTGGESVGACRTLIDLYLATGDAKYLNAVAPAVHWYRRSAIAPGKWARFYELQTNRPLYFTKEYQLTYQDNDMPTHYSFQSSYGVESMIRYFEAVRKQGRTAWLAAQTPKTLTAAQRAARAESMEKKVRTVIAAQDAQGRWITRGKLETRGMIFGDRIETKSFIDHIGVLSKYLSLLK